ncbi:MAG: pilus assembly protein PilB [Phycisphaerae bacterium]|nr:pilus assembly protein PilB [Phycisphaerae bacterium]
MARLACGSHRQVSSAPGFSLESEDRSRFVARKVRKKLGEIIVEQGLVTDDIVVAAEAESRESGKKLGEVLVDQGHATDVQVAQALAAQQGFDFVNLDTADGANQVDMSLVDAVLVRKRSIVPLAPTESGRLRVMVPDPMDLDVIDELRFAIPEDFDVVVGVPAQIAEILGGGEGASLGGAASIDVTVDKSVDRSVDASVDSSIDASIDVDAGDSKIVKLVNELIIEAVRGRASDIHVEPRSDRVALRYRVDGVCHVRQEFPKKLQQAMLARLKLMAGVNIAEKRVPQDGRIKLPIDGDQVDFRVSSCPAYHGESVVLRVLRPDSVRIGLTNIGFEEDNLEVFNKIIRRPNGIFLVTGPTGSGKTTTLYSALNVLNQPNRKIITAEDPVEYNFNGINQVQVRESIGLTFPLILKAMLRQAPNVILVGEIRDREVGDIAIQAALTGHLVFSTLHTNDAPSAITRLVDMGIKPFLVASSIQAIMAQRLIRILCNDCKQLDDNPDAKLLRLVNISPDEVAAGSIHKAVGCQKCGGKGYRGRQAIFELMPMNSEIRELAFERASISAVRQAAIRGGMRSLLGDGKVKILRGATTPDEVARFAQIEGFDPTEIEGS